MYGKADAFVKFIQLSLFIALLVATGIVLGNSYKKPLHEVNIQRQAAHLIQFVKINELSGERKITQSCSATAVGPQALLTAEHCIEGASPTITLDLSPVVYHIDTGVLDGRDHVILHIKDIQFKNTIRIVERNAKLGEHLRAYGNGGNDFPAHALHGVVINDDYEGDLSDVDAFVSTSCYSLPVVDGDSGTAVYGEDNAIVGLVSLGRGYHDHPYDYATGFALNFPPEVIEMISK